jgi:hypothetical protein
MTTYKGNKFACLFLFLLLLTLLSGARSSGEFIEVNVEIENFTWGQISEITLFVTKGTYESFQSNSGKMQLTVQHKEKVKLTAYIEVSASDLPCDIVLTLDCLLTHSGRVFPISKDTVVELKKDSRSVDAKFPIYEMDYVDPLVWYDPYGREPDSYDDYTHDYGALLIEETILSQDTRAANSGDLLILVEQSIYSGIQSNLSVYIGDAAIAGYTVQVSIYSSGDPTSIRDYVRNNISYGNNKENGCLLVGNIPAAWYEIYGCWGSYNEEFPCDLYYMDLDGMWGDSDTDGIFDTHTGDTAPEIWVGRLKADNIDGDEISLLNSYFGKNHNYKTGGLVVQKKPLIYIDDDWDYMASSIDNCFSNIYGEREVVNDKATTNADDYKARLAQPHEWVHVHCHGSPSGHTFKIPVDVWDGSVFSSDYRSINPPTFFYNFFVCSGARFTTSNYLAGSSIFNNYGLLAVGSTKTGSMLHYDEFYDPIGEEKCIGEAFKEWFTQWGESDRCWFYGMAIIGDPSLRVYMAPVTSNTSTTPDPSNCAPNITLTATVDDSTTGNSNIQAAEYFIDTIGADGTGTPMAAQDGTFDSPTENVTATVPVGGLSAGPHTVYVHGQDATGHWGTTDSYVLTVSDCIGPITSNTQVTPDQLNCPLNMTATAIVDDSTTGNSNIQAAEYFIDTIGADGTGAPMAAQDGTFDSPTENVTAVIDIAGLSLGLHTLYYHGQDAAGNWGGVQSVSFSVFCLRPTEVSPKIINGQILPLAQYRIQKTKDLSEEAQELLSEAIARGFNTSYAEELIKEAEEYLAMAQEYFRGGNYIAANMFALKAIEAYEEAIEYLKSLLG